MDFVTTLLHRNRALRLGSGKKGVLEIQEHPFLRHISWKDLLAQKVKLPKSTGSLCESKISNDLRFQRSEI